MLWAYRSCYESSVIYLFRFLFSSKNPSFKSMLHHHHHPQCTYFNLSKVDRLRTQLDIKRSCFSTARKDQIISSWTNHPVVNNWNLSYNLWSVCSLHKEATFRRYFALMASQTKDYKNKLIKESCKNNFFKNCLIIFLPNLSLTHLRKTNYPCIHHLQFAVSWSSQWLMISFL